MEQNARPKPGLLSRDTLTLPGPWGLPVVVKGSALMLPGVCLLVALSSVQSALLIFGNALIAIFLHELSHAWAARRQGITVLRLVFQGFGGACVFHVPEDRTKVIWLTLAGPMANLWLFAAALCALPFTEPGILQEGLRVCAIINVVLAILNLVPAPRCDGGVILLRSLAIWLPEERATRISGWVALMFALALPAIVIGGVLATGSMLFYWVNPRLAWRMADRGSFADPDPVDVTMRAERVRGDHPLLLAARRMQAAPAA